MKRILAFHFLTKPINLFPFFALLLFFNLTSFSGVKSQDSLSIYLIPGQGADHRLFSKLQLEKQYKTKHIHYELPAKKMSLKAYARQLSTQIDTSEKFVLIGASLGGMLATEMNDFLNPEKVILIASAKSRKELPGRYNFQKKIPIYKLVPGRLAKWGALLLQPIVEPDRNKEKQIFVDMLKGKDPKFFRRTIEMIITWEREDIQNDIIHIHGNRDHTIPIKNVKYDYLIENGSHVMTLTRAEELSVLINCLIKNKLSNKLKK